MSRIPLLLRLATVATLSIFWDVRALAMAPGSAYMCGGIRPNVKYMPPHTDGIYLLGHVSRLDLISQDIHIRWRILGSGNYSYASMFPVHGRKVPCTVPNIPVELYYDGSTIANASYDPSSAFIFEHATGAFVTIRGGRFTTQHMLDWDLAGRQLTAYPLDEYHTKTTIQAIRPDLDNATIPILAVSLVDATNSWAPTIMLDIETHLDTATGIGTSLNETQFEHSRTFRVSFCRTRGAKAYAFILFVGTWLLTFVVVAIAVQTWAGRRRPSDAMVLFPASAIVTLPALRALWPGAPPFGLYLDMLGTVPQMSVLAVLLLTALYHQP